MINLMILFLVWNLSVAWEPMQDRMHSPLEWYLNHISLLSATKGQWRLSWLSAIRSSQNLSIKRSCGLPPLFWPGSLSWNVLSPFLSNFLRPSSLLDVLSNQTRVVVSHSPLYILFCREPNSARTPNSMSYIYIILQECRKTCTLLWNLSMRYAPKKFSFDKVLLQYYSKWSIWQGRVVIEKHSGLSSPR